MENDPKSMMNCQYCKKVYTNKYTLNTHQKTAKACLKLQKNNTAIKCHYCEKTFSSQSSLNLHQKTNKTCHTKTNTNEQQRELISFDCNGCDKTFTTKAALAKHNSICSNIKKYLNEKKELEEKLLNERNERKDMEEKFLKTKTILEAETKDSKEEIYQNKIKITELYSKLKTLEKQLEKEETKVKNLQDRLL
jgi:chromosome segregation ATPase